MISSRSTQLGKEDICKVVIMKVEGSVVRAAYREREKTRSAARCARKMRERVGKSRGCGVESKIL